jgi:hypothetical protein
LQVRPALTIQVAPLCWTSVRRSNGQQGSNS